MEIRQGTNILKDFTGVKLSKSRLRISIRQTILFHQQTDFKGRRKGRDSGGFKETKEHINQLQYVDIIWILS